MPIHVSRLASCWWFAAVVPFATLGMQCRTGQEAATPNAGAPALSSDLAQRSIQVRGQFEPDGSSLRRVHPLRIVNRTASLQHRSVEGMFRLSVDYESDPQDTLRFDAYVEGDANPGRREFGPFTVEVALRESATLRRVTLTDASGRREFVSWTGDQLPR